MMPDHDAPNPKNDAETAELVEQHRRSYLAGSGDGLLYLVEAEMRKALQAKRPDVEREPDQQRRPRRRVF